MFNTVGTPLSNFAALPFAIKDDFGLEYPTVEHAYQASKFGTPAQREQVRDLPKPHDAKKLTKGLKLDAQWHRDKEALMERFLWQKFTKDPFRKLLLGIDDEIVELNWWGDTFWGRDEKTGEGKNNLGILLMKIRADLRRELPFETEVEQCR